MAKKVTGTGSVLHCSFCGKNQHEVRKLIAGPSVFICNECIDLCRDIIKEEKEEKTGRKTGGVPTPNEIKKQHTEVHRLEEEVSKLEARQNELAAALEAPETYSDKGKFHHLNLELSTLVDQLAVATAAWEQAAEKLAELEKL